jgi:transposase
MGTLTLTDRQQRAVRILERLEAGSVDAASAAKALGISARQLRRKRARFRAQGMVAVVHGNQGRRPVNRMDAATRARIVALAGKEGRYAGVNVSHMQELLAREEQIVVGRSTLDRLLKEAGVRTRQTKAKAVHRHRRQRKGAAGMLVQIDGSPYHWVGAAQPMATLIGAIDDATGKVLYLHLRPTEDQLGYLLLLHTLARTHGRPMALYHDRHTILRSPKTPTLEEELAGELPMSQIQRMLHVLGIESIAASSPQAKGRIERLWGTLQQRLTTELRLAGAATLAEANACLAPFLEQFNARFAVQSLDPEPAWRPLPNRFDDAYVFAVREERKVSRDHCVRFGGRILQLLPSPKRASLAGKTLHVHVTPEGETLLYAGRERLAYTTLKTSVPKPATPAVANADTDARPVVTATRPAPSTEPAARRKPTANQRAWAYG